MRFREEQVRLLAGLDHHFDLTSDGNIVVSSRSERVLLDPSRPIRAGKESCILPVADGQYMFVSPAEAVMIAAALELPITTDKTNRFQVSKVLDINLSLQRRVLT